MAFEDILKRLEKGAKKDPHTHVYRPGDITMGSHIPFGIPSGIPRLDLRLGKPGLPAGKVIEFYGFQMSGKTTAALHAIAQAQRLGGSGILIDTERAYDTARTAAIGVNTDVNFTPIECDTLEATFRTLNEIVQAEIENPSGTPVVVVVDSVTAVTSEAEYDKEFGEVARIGEDARVLRWNMRKLMGDLAKSKVCIIFINHAVSKMAANKYAKQSDSAGGYAIKFFASLRCEFRNAGWEMTADKKGRVGQKIGVKIEKSKLGELRNPQINDVILKVDNGFDLATELFQAGIESGWLGRPNAQTYTYTDPDDSETLEFKKADWPRLVENSGGPYKLYKEWRQWCREHGKITDWSEIYG